MDSLPHPSKWWPTYVFIGAGAFVAASMAFHAGLEIFKPLSHLAQLLLFAVVIAFAIAPFAAKIEKAVGNRALSIGLAYLIVILVVLVIAVLIARPIIEQVSYIIERIPVYVERIRSSEPLVIGGFEIPSQLREQLLALS